MATTVRTGSLCWFDLPVDDEARAQKFYKELFGWEFPDLTPDSEQSYYGLEGTGLQPSPEAAKMLGGMIKRQHPGHGITIYFAVPSVDEYSTKVGELGGQVIMPKMAVGEFGFFATCLDTEGNTFAIWESR